MKSIVCVHLVILLAFVAAGSMAQAQDDLAALQTKLDALKEKLNVLRPAAENAKVNLEDALGKMNAFDVSKASKIDEPISIPGTKIAKKITYKDELGNTLIVFVDETGNPVKQEFHDIATGSTLVKEISEKGAIVKFTTATGEIVHAQLDPAGNIANLDYYDPLSGNRIIIEYDAAGKAASIKLIDEINKQELTMTNTATGSTVVFHDVVTGDVLKVDYDGPDGTGNVVSSVPRKTEGLGPKVNWCPNTGQWEIVS